MTTGSDWQGRVGDVWADEWQRTDRSFAGLAPALNAAILNAAPEAGLAIDIGCGAGATAIALAEARPGLTIEGVDLSPALIATASARGRSCANLAFRVGDSQALGARSAQLLFSRHGVMFFDDPVAAFASLRATLAPGGRLVFSCFRAPADNPWATLIGTGSADPAPGYVPGPFAFADADFVTELLRRGGWRDIATTPVDYAYIAGAGDDAVADACSFFSRVGPVSRALATAEPPARAQMLAALESALADRCRDNAVTFPAAAWIWTAANGDS